MELYKHEKKSMRTSTSNILTIMLFCVICITTFAQERSTLVYFNDHGSLEYKKFSMTGQTNEVNTIPDFSHAGYKGGGVKLPDVPVKVTIEPQGGDMHQIIQNAINSVSAMPLDENGFRGAVLLLPGIYEVSNSIVIETDGVILRGSGQSRTGTIIYATKKSQHEVIGLYGKSNDIVEDALTKQLITTPYVAVGKMGFTVANASGFKVGDTISVRKTPNQKWIDDLDVGQYGWTTRDYAIQHERIITGIDGDSITINIPIVDVIEEQFGGGYIAKAKTDRLSHCGVENLWIRSYYAHDEDEDHAWDAILLYRVQNSWVKNVTAEHMGYSCVKFKRHSSYNTVQDCAAIDHKSQIAGSRRYSFVVEGGLANLIQRCYTREGRHDFVVQAQVTGPNVFLDCYGENCHADIGPHHRWATGNLFDNIIGQEIRVQNRGDAGTGHGWAGAQTMFWYCHAHKIKVESPLGAMNWGVACSGKYMEGDGFHELWEKTPTPRSLYIQQLKDRLGQEAVNDIVIPEQLEGQIHDLLKEWRGEGSLVKEEIASSNKKITVSDDSYVQGGDSENKNFGSSSDMLVKTAAEHTTRVPYLKFDLSDLPGNTVNATLVLTMQDSKNEMTYSFLLVDDNWDESTITKNNAPSFGKEIARKKVIKNSKTVEIDITEIAAQEKKKDGYLSLAIVGVERELITSIRTKEAGIDVAPAIFFEVGNTLHVGYDSYVKSGESSSINFGMADSLCISKSEEEESYLKFSFKNVPESFQRTVLKLFVKKNSFPEQGTYNLILSNNEWNSNIITWDNRSENGELYKSFRAPEKGQCIILDVTPLAQAAMFDDQKLSFRIVEESNGYPIQIYSLNHENESLRPQLLIQDFNRIYAHSDASLKGGSNANTNFGSSNTLLSKDSYSDPSEVILRFPLSEITNNIASAILTITPMLNVDLITHNVLYTPDDSWQEGDISYQTKPHSFEKNGKLSIRELRSTGRVGYYTMGKKGKTRGE